MSKNRSTWEEGVCMQFSGIQMWLKALSEPFNKASQNYLYCLQVVAEHSDRAKTGIFRILLSRHHCVR